jgi:hypothetical protein
MAEPLALGPIRQEKVRIALKLIDLDLGCAAPDLRGVDYCQGARQSRAKRGQGLLCCQSILHWPFETLSILTLRCDE